MSRASAGGYGGTYASVGPSGQDGGYARGSSARGRSAARENHGGRSIEADLCSGQTAGLTDWPIERIAQTVELNDDQRAILDELRDATAKALDQLKAACPTALPSAPTGRIEAMGRRAGATCAAVRSVACKRWSSASTRCAGRSKPCSPRSRSFMARSATSRRSASIASRRRRGNARE